MIKPKRLIPLTTEYVLTKPGNTMPIFSRLFGGKSDHEHTTDSPELIRKNIADGIAVMLDVRGQEERDAGYLKNSIFIPFTEIQALPEGSVELQSLDKSMIVYCH